jgi:BolA protein
VSQAFAGQNAVGRHRMVYQALGDLMKTRIHALSITALTSDEL